jgi:dimethylamine monooxygenase subunit A
MTPILQRHIPHLPWMDAQMRRLPGTKPLHMADWLVVDEAYAQQMALRDHLIAQRAEAVHAALPQALRAAHEVYDLILPLLPGLGFRVQGAHVVRPDGVVVPLDESQPLLTLGRLVQEDLCIMQLDGAGEHALTAAILCFPAGWMLAEKLGRPMMRIHQPVMNYTDDVGRRVQRLMDMVRVGAPLWRANAHHSDAPLHNPLSEVASHQGYQAVPVRSTDKPFIRSERQALIRLPVSGAVLFSIHTYIIRRADLTPEQAAGLAEYPIHVSR